ncbi:MAG: SRPBCC domain-containing protein [Holophagales bacterium]|nr:SRPBCC domain-containing protein [Holophagales bacterium]
MKQFSLALVSPLALFVLLATAAVGGAEETDPRSAVGQVTDKVIHISAFVPITPAEAYTYFTDNRRLQSWLTASADVEPKVGGKYELFWEPDDRENNSTIGCRVTAASPGQVLAFQWRSPKQFKPFANTADPLTHAVVSFVAEGSGTRVHLLHSGWRSSQEWEEARVWQERAWIGAFERLERVAEK